MLLDGPYIRKQQLSGCWPQHDSKRVPHPFFVISLYAWMAFSLFCLCCPDTSRNPDRDHLWLYNSDVNAHFRVCDANLSEIVITCSVNGVRCDTNSSHMNGSCYVIPIVLQKGVMANETQLSLSLRSTITLQEYTEHAQNIVVFIGPGKPLI